MFCNIIIMVVASIMLVGCTTNEGKLNSWLGNDVNHVITYWGPPDSIYETNDGGIIIKYSHSRIAGKTPAERVLFPKRFYCDANFTSDSNEKIIDVGMKGNLEDRNWLIKGKP